MNNKICNWLVSQLHLNLLNILCICPFLPINTVAFVGSWVNLHSKTTVGNVSCVLGVCLSECDGNHRSKQRVCSTRSSPPDSTGSVCIFQCPFKLKKSWHQSKYQVPSCYQFIMEFLLRVMKKTWLLPPDLTDAKNTCLGSQDSNVINGKFINRFWIHAFV